jgi:microcystin-dependent protein
MVANMASHTHAASATVSGSSTISGYLPGSQANGTSPTPGTNNFPAGVVSDSSGSNLTPYGPSDGTTRMPVTISGNITGLNITNSGTGSNAPFSIMQPYLALNYVIFTLGLYPPRP